MLVHGGNVGGLLLVDAAYGNNAHGLAGLSIFYRQQQAVAAVAAQQVLQMLHATHHGRFRRNRYALAAGAFIGHVYQHRAVGGAWHIAVAYRVGGFALNPLLFLCVPDPEGESDFAAQVYDHLFLLRVLFHVVNGGNMIALI